MAEALGRDVRATRRRLHMTQADLALRVGVHQTWVSDIELGRGHGAPISLWVAIGLALGRPLAVSLTRSADPDAILMDAGHLELQEFVFGLAAALGRRATVERASNPRDPWHSTDVAITDDARRILILVEAWNTFGDVGAALRSTQRKEAEARWTPGIDRVASVWVIRRTVANRAIVARYPNLFASTFAGSSHAWVRALTDGHAPPDQPGIVWYDPSGRRLVEWRRR